MSEVETEFLDLDDVLSLAAKLLGEPVPIRDAGLLASAVARPQTSIGGQDAYPTLVEKASALLQSIIINHALVDGNKRLGWVCTAVFLQINGVDVTRISNDSVYDFVYWVASTNPQLDDIVTSFRLLLK